MAVIYDLGTRARRWPTHADADRPTHPKPPALLRELSVADVCACVCGHDIPGRRTSHGRHVMEDRMRRSPASTILPPLYSSLKSGFAFSMKAFIPIFWSAVAKVE